MTNAVFHWPVSSLVQITDCHLLATPDALYQGIKPYHHLRLVLDELRAEAPLLILTGDLTEDHSADSYTLLQQLLADWHRLFDQLATLPDFDVAWTWSWPAQL